ncbi:MAG TPA: COX15/CtaA family protein [Candidatus Xenobia bacterium]|nr:COX15/CtaA family protein [Candidatus Xenobia bacterium]
MWLHRYALLTAAATFCLIIAGALVTSHEAGLAVPDWPLSYGQLMPPMVGNIFWEHGHRMVAAFVGLLTIGLAVWLSRREPRRWVRRLGWMALGAVVLQGLLGGLTVLFLLPRPVSIAHASLAQLFFCLTVSLALFTSRGWRQERPLRRESSEPPLRRLAVATTAAVFLQLMLGAAYRHDAAGILPHLVGAAVVTIGTACVWGRVRKEHGDEPALRLPAAILRSLLILQLLLGGAAYWTRVATAEAPQPQLIMVALTVAHVATGALVLAASLIVTLQAYRRLAPREAQAAMVSAAEKAA